MNSGSDFVDFSNLLLGSFLVLRNLPNKVDGSLTFQDRRWGYWFRHKLAASYNNGLEAGIAEGREESREAERLEGQKRLIASAKKMVASGVDIDLVCSTLGVDKAAVLRN